MTGYVVTGTDTDVGKTVVAAGLAAALGATYWKPVQAGLDGGTDAATVRRLAPQVRVLPEAYRLTTPCSPHAAARIDGVRIADDALALPGVAGPLIVEGAGGLLVPIRTDLLSAQLFARWDLPLIIVARTRLGTINHTLLTVAAARAHGLEVAGIVFSGAAEPVAQDAIATLADAPMLGRLPLLDPLDAASLAAAMRDHVRLDLLA